VEKPEPEPIPKRVDDTDAAIGNREPRAPDLPSDTGDEGLR
jgi:hypothetical protein